MTKIQEYVLCFPYHVNESYWHNTTSDVVLVNKLKPDWQKDKLNLVGGHVEEGENPIWAAARELIEETGLYSNPLECEVIGKIVNKSYVVHVVLCPCIPIDGRPQKPKSKTNELVETFYIREILNNKKLIPNLKVIIPLCVYQVKNWTIYDNDNSDWNLRLNEETV